MSCALHPLNVRFMVSPHSPALDGTLGALEVGTVTGTFLFGILTLQTFNYYRRFPKDSKTLRTTIGILWLLELAHTICCLHGIYLMTVTFYGEPTSEIILNPPASHILSLVFSGGIDALVQIFFGNRFRMLSGRPHIFFLCIALAIARFTCDMILMSSFWIYKEGYLALQSKLHWAIVTASTLGPAGDVVVALAMCYYLWRLRKSEFHRTRSMVDTLLVWTFETTLVTSVSAILQLFFFLTRKDLFSNSMLAVLNGRTRFRSPEATFISQPLDFGAAGTRTRCEDENHYIITDTMPSAPGVVVHISSTTEDYNDKDDISSKRAEAEIEAEGELMVALAATGQAAEDEEDEEDARLDEQ
ncbi:hypothetical protein C8R44DRAFT_973458 [Mycena epipterygia]|nr:hypothetical protein C8R44DRAFT_973458 [Mycena epipterygia]